MSAAYVIYVLAVTAMFLFWLVAFAILRRQKDAKPSDLMGFLLVGPMHFYLKRRNFQLSNREIIGWGIVLALMLAAPALSSALA